MSFNSVTLIVASIIFVISLCFIAYFIYQDQKSKFVMVQSTCPDFWEKDFIPDASGNYYCKQKGINIGTCSISEGVANRPPEYKVINTGTECDIYKRKMAWINTNPCVKNILWDGVTNNPQLKAKCK